MRSLPEWQPGKAHHCQGSSLGNTNCKVSSAPKNYAEEELQPIKLVLCTHHCDPNRKVEVMAKLIKVNYTLFDTFTPAKVMTKP